MVVGLGSGRRWGDWEGLGVVPCGDDGQKRAKTYNTGDSPVVTDLSTDPAVSSLSRGERTGSRVFYCLWSYVLECRDAFALSTRGLRCRVQPTWWRKRRWMVLNSENEPPQYPQYCVCVMMKISIRSVCAVCIQF